MRSFTKPILIALFAHLIFSLQAQTCVTTATGAWNNTATWVDGIIPSYTNDVIINHNVAIKSTVQCKNITVNAVLTSEAGSDIDAKGLMTVNSGTVEVAGTIKIQDNLIVSATGAIEMSNSASNLTVGQSGSHDKQMTVNGNLTITAGTLNILGNIVFNPSSNFALSGGEVYINGNNGLTGGVADGIALVDFKTGGVRTITGGNFIFRNPHPVSNFPNFILAGNVDLSNCTVSIGTGDATNTDSPFIFGDDITFGEINVLYVTGTNNYILFGLNNVVNGNFTMGDGLLRADNGVTFKGNILCSADDPERLEAINVVEGTLVCNGTPTRISGNGNFQGATLQSSLLNGNGYILIDNNLMVQDLELYNSIVLANNTILTFTGAINPSGTSNKNGKIIVSGINSRLRTNIQVESNAFFPVATSTLDIDYAPVTIENTSPTTFWSVGVKSTVDSLLANSKKVNLQWDIAGGTRANITVQWDEAQEEVGFNRPTCDLYHWNDGAKIWEATVVNSRGNTSPTHSLTTVGWSSFSPFAVFSQAALPVELMSFTGKTQQNKALLTWQTATEKNNKGFEVEKSFDGQTFDNIGFVKGNGNSTLTQKYDFTDANFIQNAYYRLKQVDANGDFEYSKIIALTVGNAKSKSTVKAYPNPMADVLTVETSVSETSQLEIIDAVGRVVFKQNVESGNYQIPTSTLTRGMYILKLTNKNDSLIQKIIKN